MRLAPGDPDPRNGLGVLAVESGDLDRAAALFREVLAIDPALHDARLNLAVVYARQQRLAEARAELRAILAVPPRPRHRRAAPPRSSATCPEAPAGRPLSSGVVFKSLNVGGQPCRLIKEDAP